MKNIRRHGCVADFYENIERSFIWQNQLIYLIQQKY